MVTSRIPTYTLNNEFNREFRSFRVSRLQDSSPSSHIVPVHEFSRFSLKERRAALREAFDRAAAPEKSRNNSSSWAASDGRALIARCDTLQERRAALKAAFEKNADCSRSVIKKNDVKSDGKDDSKISSKFDKSNKDSRLDAKESRIFAKIGVRDEVRGDIRKDNKEKIGQHSSFDYSKYSNINKTDDLKAQDKKTSDLKSTTGKTYSSFGRTFLTASDKKSKAYDIFNNNNDDEDEGLSDLRKFPRVNFNLNSGSESMIDIRIEDNKTIGKTSKTTMAIRGRTLSMNGISSMKGESRFAGADSRGDACPSPDSGVALGDSPPEGGRSARCGALPAMYLTMASWTPKSNAFRNRLRDHESSISYVHPRI